MGTPTVIICTAAKRVDCNRVWEAMGRGPDTWAEISGRLTTDAGAETWVTAESGAWPGAVTHHGAHDGSTEAADFAAWSAMVDGILPTLPAGKAWGIGGVISEADALAAVTDGNLRVYSGSSNVDSVALFRGAVREAGLYFVPSPPL